jgi:glycosyltransferase involved in cell wall biosynthesis
VEILRSAGFDAHVVHHRHAFRVAWFASSAPVLYAEGGLALDPADWVVIPEDHPDALEGFRNVSCRKAIFCQGHYHVFDHIPPGSAWTDYGVTEVLVSSLPIRDFVRDVFGLASTYVPLSLDPGLFRPLREPRQFQVAFMPRKGGHHLRLLQGILNHRAPDLRESAWIAIDGRPAAEVASILQQSVFFLSTGVREGFGLPPLEAMACGAMVVGFRAGGGMEYATEANGFWIADEDPLALAGKLIELLRAYRDQRANPRWESVQSLGYATAARYTRAAEAGPLIEFWKARAGRAALAP